MDFFDALTIVYPYAGAGRALAKEEIVKGFEAEAVPYTKEQIDEAFKVVELAMMDHVTKSKMKKIRKG